MTDEWVARATAFLHNVQMGSGVPGNPFGGVAAVVKKMGNSLPSRAEVTEGSAACSHCEGTGYYFDKPCWMCPLGKMPGAAGGPTSLINALRHRPQAVADEHETKGPLDPDVSELCDHFHIEERHVHKLNDIMMSRKETFEGDMLKLWDELERAKVPNGMLVVTMREMEAGRFIGKRTHQELNNLVDKHKLDDTAQSKLEDILGRYPEQRRQDYIKSLDAHLETTSRPSAMVMLLLKKLGSGEDLGRPTEPTANRRNEDHGGDGRERNRDRERDRDRDRRKDRSRSRKR